ncbi:MAG TPA: polysaccharide biosynthesis tyrosine autokinase [Thermoguttaceae bacterium]|nr:polysaccharide biosynthesis tyrosine autokinase [Thermoguttaceae bacterium]
MTRITSRISQQRPGRSTPNETSQAMSLHFALNALRQWWKIATPVGLVLSVSAAALVWLTFTPMYTASTAVKIKDTAPFLAFRTGDNTRRFVQTQLVTIKQVPVLGAAMKNLGGLPELKEREDPIAWLASELNVASLGDSELYRISIAGPDPDNAKKIVKEVTDAYLAQYNEETDKNTRDLIALLKREEDDREAAVEQLRNTARTLAIDNVGADPYEVASQPQPTEDPAYTTVRSQLVSAEVESTILEARVTVLENRLGRLRQLKPATVATEEAAPATENTAPSPEEPVLAVEEATPVSENEDTAPSPEVTLLTAEEIGQEIATLVPDWMVEQAVYADPEVQMRQAALTAKQSKLSDIERLAVNGKDSELYKNLAKEIDEEQVGLNDFCEDLSRRYRAGLVEQRVLEQEVQLDSLKLALANQKALMKTLEEKRDEQKVEEKVYRGITFDMEIADKNLADGERVLDLIRDRRIKLEAEEKADDRVTLFQPAIASKVPSDPLKKVLLAAMAGMLFPFGLAVAWEFLAKRVGDPKDLQRQSNLPVVGEIARIPSRARASGGFASGSGGFALGMFEESIDSLRTNLVLSEDLKEMRVLAVTSAINHEGKTSVSAQLAISLARASGKKTLLIDGDMRCPDIHNVFDIPLEPGLAEVLSGQCSLEDVIVTDWSDHVHLVAAGKLHMSPHKLLGNGSVKELLASVPDTYRYIVIDTPPVLAASEALVLAKAADASLLCAMQDVSRIDQVMAACNRLESAGSRPVGTVLNGVPTKRYAYRYGSYAYSRH